MEVVAYHFLNDLTDARNLIKMCLELFQKVLAGAIETLFDDQNQPLFKRPDLGKYLSIRNIRDNFKEFSSHHARPRSEIEGVGVTTPLGGQNILMIYLLIWIFQLKLLFALKNARQLP